MIRRGFTLLEVILALVVITIALLPLLGQHSNALYDTLYATLTSQAARIAEDGMAAILTGGYAAFTEGRWRPADGTAPFDCAADFTAEEIRKSLLIEAAGAPPPEADAAAATAAAPEQEDMIVVYHIAVTVTSREFPDIRVRLALDIPAGAMPLLGVEDLVPAPAEGAGNAP
ncbi:MAG: prepilin-type N-terminal cleavage/methylation domain-containing protein [Planctomycetota bacterium]